MYTGRSFAEPTWGVLKSLKKNRYFFKTSGNHQKNCLEWFRTAKHAQMTLLRRILTPRTSQKTRFGIHTFGSKTRCTSKSAIWKLFCSKTLQSPYFAGVLTYKTHNDVETSRYRYSFTWPKQVKSALWGEKKYSCGSQPWGDLKSWKQNRNFGKWPENIFGVV